MLVDYYSSPVSDRGRTVYPALPGYCYNTSMNPKPAISSIFWFFMIVSGLFVGNKSLFLRTGGTCLTGSCHPPVFATSPQPETADQVEQLLPKE